MNLQPEFLENLLVSLKPLSATDFNTLYQVASDPLIWKQHPQSDRYKQEVFQRYFDGAIESQGAFLVFDKESEELIGCTRYYDYNPSKSNVAIGFTFLIRKCWGGKYNQAMKKLLLDHAFQYVDSVLFHVGPKNLRSQKALLKIGAKEIGEFVNEAGAKSLEFEIRKEDWKSRLLDGK